MQEEDGRKIGEAWNRSALPPGGNEARHATDDGRLRINLTSDSWRLRNDSEEPSTSFLLHRPHFHIS